MATASVSLDQTLADFMADCYADPLAFVLGAYPWGEPGPLKDHPGPDEWQADLLRTIGKAVRGHKFNGTKPVPPIRAAVSSGHGIGKAQPSDAVIPTPDGDRRFGDLCPGGRVWGRDGTPTRVVAVHEQGVLPTYRVRFDDGSEARVTGDHLWSVRGRQQRRNGLGWATMTTKGILNSGVKRPNGVAQARQWEIPTSAAVDLPPVDLPLDPYALGVWLGDGSRCGARFTSADSEVIGTLRNRGMVVVKNAAKYQWAMAGVAVALRVLGVFLNYSYQKRVPVAYINASAEQRAWLLRGLLDTDGECTPGGSVGFSSTSRPLVADVVRLARSLGGKAQHHPSVHKPKYPDAEGHLLAGRDSFRATVTMPDGFAPFTIERKAARVKPVQDRYRHRWIDSIEPDNETDCRCITVAAADGLYLTNDYIVTHNSVMAAWLVDWIMSTRPHSRGTVTANTYNQLDTKTWAAVKHWTALCLTAHWFVANDKRLYQKDNKNSWFCAPASSKEDNSEAFAGQHAADATSFYIFDEDSGIPDKVHEVAEGGLTDGEPMIFLFGNCTRTTGHFYRACFGAARNLWKPVVVDSRSSRFTNKEQIEEWIDLYGEDSDFVRVRVRGIAPRASDAQFIDQDRVLEAQKRQVVVLPDEPLVAGCDLAWGGSDDNVVRFRRGADGRSIKPIRVKGEFTRDPQVMVTRLAEVLTKTYDGHKIHTLFVDSAGIAGPIGARLRALGHRNVQEVNFGSDSPSEKARFMRDYMWAGMKEWLLTGAIDDEPQLEADLLGPGTRPDRKQRVWLESKEDMKRRGVDSPDDGDALALTFAAPIAAPRKAKHQAPMPREYQWT